MPCASQDSAEVIKIHPTLTVSCHLIKNFKRLRSGFLGGWGGEISLGLHLTPWHLARLMQALGCGHMCAHTHSYAGFMVQCAMCAYSCNAGPLAGSERWGGCWEPSGPSEIKRGSRLEL